MYNSIVRVQKMSRDLYFFSLFHATETFGFGTELRAPSSTTTWLIRKVVWLSASLNYLGWPTRNAAHFARPHTDTMTLGSG